MYRLRKLRLMLDHALWFIRLGLRRADTVLRSRWVVLPLLAFITAMIYGRYITQLNIFVFHDDGNMIVHNTYQSDVMAALEEVGIYISKPDFVDGPAQPIQGSVAEVVITRRFWVNVFFDGRSFSVPTTGETVKAILDSIGFESKPGDIVEPPLETRVEDGMEIHVRRTEITYEDEVEEIDYQTIVQTNKNLNEHSQIVVQDGIPGSRTMRYEVTRIEGVVDKRELVEIVVVEPVDEIIEKGLRKTVTMRDGTVLAYSRKLQCTATAYTTENKTRKINALGRIARTGTIAVDSTLIPLLSKVYVTSRNSKWEYGVAVAEDVGGFRGNHVDLFFDTRAECIQFGKRTCYVYVLE